VTDINVRFREENCFLERVDDLGGGGGGGWGGFS
jgi:hypothetical protein